MDQSGSAYQKNAMNEFYSICSYISSDPIETKCIMIVLLNSAWLAFLLGIAAGPTNNCSGTLRSRRDPFLLLLLMNAQSRTSGISSAAPADEVLRNTLQKIKMHFS